MVGRKSVTDTHTPTKLFPKYRKHSRLRRHIPTSAHISARRAGMHNSTASHQCTLVRKRICSTTNDWQVTVHGAAAASWFAEARPKVKHTPNKSHESKLHFLCNAASVYTFHVLARQSWASFCTHMFRSYLFSKEPTHLAHYTVMFALVTRVNRGVN